MIAILYRGIEGILGVTLSHDRCQKITFLDNLIIFDKAQKRRFFSVFGVKISFQNYKNDVSFAFLEILKNNVLLRRC